MELYAHLLRSIEVPKFDTDTGRKLILAMVARDSCTTTEKEAAESLSQELGELALGLVIAAKRIRRQGVKIHDSLLMKWERGPCGIATAAWSQLIP
jgi:hypothetical protein